MVDIQTISIAIASAGVFVGAIYYVLQIRHQTRMRQSDLLMRMHLAFSSKDYTEAGQKMLSTNYKDYDDFVDKYGHPWSEGPVQTAFIMMWMFFDGIGILAKRKLAEIGLITDLFDVDLFWKKSKPLIESLRKEFNHPSYYWAFEYLANETKKRQQLAPKTA